MASNINPLHPVTGTPTTQSVRDNFAHAKSEIDALQADFAGLDAAALRAQDLGVSVQPYDINTAKTDASISWAEQQHHAKALTEQYTAVAASTIDVSAAAVHSKTITTATAFALIGVPAAGAVASFVLELTNGGAAAITWWAGLKWPGGTVPTLTAAGLDLLGFYTHDGGTTWRGMMLAKDSK